MVGCDCGRPIGPTPHALAPLTVQLAIASAAELLHASPRGLRRLVGGVVERVGYSVAEFRELTRQVHAEIRVTKDLIERITAKSCGSPSAMPSRRSGAGKSMNSWRGHSCVGSEDGQRGAADACRAFSALLPGRVGARRVPRIKRLALARRRYRGPRSRPRWPSTQRNRLSGRQKTPPTATARSGFSVPFRNCLQPPLALRLCSHLASCAARQRLGARSRCARAEAHSEAWLPSASRCPGVD